MAQHPLLISRKFCSYFQSVALFFVFLAGCSKPPQIPFLPKRDVHPIEKVVFPNAIGPKEIRQMFEALNRDGRLNRLKPYFYDPSDDSLGRVGSLFTEFFYRRALENEGFPALLNRHTDSRDFSDIEQWFKKQSPLLSIQTGNLIAHPLFKEAIDIDYRFLAPEWMSLFGELLPNGFGFEKVSEADSILWSTDVLTLLNDATVQQTALDAASAFGQGRLASSLTGFVSRLDTKDATELALRVSDLSADTKRPLTKIYSLFTLLAKHPPGLLVAAFDKLDKEPDLRAKISDLLFSQVYDAVSSSVLSALATQPLDTPADRFIALRTAIDEIARTKPVIDVSETLIANLPIYLPALALSFWIEEIVKAPANKTLKERLYGKKSGAVDLNLDLLPPELDLEIFIKKGDALELNPVVAKHLKDIDLEAFSTLLQKAANSPGLGNFRYQITFSDKKVSFPKALEECVRQLETIRPFGDGALLARVFFKRLLNNSMRERLETLDGQDWLLFIHHKLLDPDFWPSVREILFSTNGLFSEEGDTKRMLLSLFDGNLEHVKYLEELFNEMPLLQKLDRSPKGQRSLLSFYLDFNNSLGPREKKSLVKLALEASHLLGLSEARARGPLKGFVALLSKPKSLNTLITFVSNAGRQHNETFLAPFIPWGKYGTEAAVQTHWNLMKATFGTLPVRDLALLVQSPIFDFSFIPRANGVNSDDYLWLVRLVEKRGWAGLHDYFSANSSRRSMSEFLTAAQELETSGYLDEIFFLMQRIQDERVRAFAAALQNWRQSGEMSRGLTFLKTLVN